MQAFQEYIREYERLLENGKVQKAYKGLIEYIVGLKAFFKTHYPGYFVSGSIYYGYLDMSYFSFTPQSLKQRDLKIAIVLIHQPLHFEAWLAGMNKQVQSRYWKMFQSLGWDKYPLVPTTRGVDAILTHILVKDPDFSDLDQLTRQIETETLLFVNEIERFIDQVPAS